MSLIKKLLNLMSNFCGQDHSRFLHLSGHNQINLKEAITESRIYSSKDIIYAELGGVFDNNNNIHKKLTEYIILFPGQNNYIKSNKKINLSELVIKLDENDLPIIYSEKLNKRIIPIHIGLNNDLYFPDFYQFLMNFEPSAPYLPKYHLIKVPDFKTEPVIPRVVIGNIILARKRWYIKRSNIPRKEHYKTNIEYLLAIQTWRMKKIFPQKFS